VKLKRQLLRRLGRSLKGHQRFLDASIFINWLKVDPSKASRDERALVSGYILHKIETGESAVTSVTVKDEVAVWLSRYKPPTLRRFIELLLGYTSLEIACPTIEDQLDATKSFGKYSLGYTDSLSLSLMAKYGISEIYSSDTGFDSIPSIRRVFDQLVNEREFEQFKQTLANPQPDP